MKNKTTISLIYYSAIEFLDLKAAAERQLCVGARIQNFPVICSPRWIWFNRILVSIISYLVEVYQNFIQHKKFELSPSDRIKKI